MADKVTQAVALYIKNRGISVSAVSRGTKIPDGILRRSVSSLERNLRASEFIDICAFLEEDPASFATSRENSAQEREVSAWR